MGLLPAMVQEIGDRYEAGMLDMETVRYVPQAAKLEQCPLCSKTYKTHAELDEHLENTCHAVRGRKVTEMYIPDPRKILDEIPEGMRAKANLTVIRLSKAIRESPNGRVHVTRSGDVNSVQNSEWPIVASLFAKQSWGVEYTHTDTSEALTISLPLVPGWK